MGFVSTEQTTAIIDSVAKVVEANNPDVVMRAEPNMAFGKLLALAIAPVIIIPIFLWIKKLLREKKSGR